MGTAFDHEPENRFLRYVKVNTTVDPASPTSLSTRIQFGLLNLQMEELKEIGAQDVTLTGYGAVLASIPATVQGAAPTVGLLAHVLRRPGRSQARSIAKRSVWLHTPPHRPS